MLFTKSPARRLESADKPFNPGQRHHRADFARAATISAFGRNAWALDHADFVDRQPGLAPFGKIAGRIVQRLTEEREVQSGSR